jgi:molybdopterin synthase sulfur carrier subunit
MCAMSINVIVPAVLRGFTGRAREVPGRGATLREVVANLEADHPGLGPYLVDEQGQQRPSVNLFVNDQNARSLLGLDTPLKDGDTVAIVPSASGG